MAESSTHVPLKFEERPVEEMRDRAQSFYRLMNGRRSVREFSDRAVPRDLIATAIQTAGTAPSGANRQPWTFVAVDDQEIKREIREAAEGEEKKNYEERMSEEWLEALDPIGTDWQKPFLETAPWIVVCFAESYSVEPDGAKQKLLRAGERRYCLRALHCDVAQHGTRDAHPHAGADVVFERHPRPALQ